MKRFLNIRHERWGQGAADRIIMGIHWRGNRHFNRRFGEIRDVIDITSFIPPRLVGYDDTRASVRDEGKYDGLV